MGARACQDSHEYDRGECPPSDEHRTSCSWSGGGDLTITTSDRQHESWTKTALGHEKNVVRVIATEAKTVAAAEVRRV